MHGIDHAESARAFANMFVTAGQELCRSRRNTGEQRGTCRGGESLNRNKIAEAPCRSSFTYQYLRARVINGGPRVTGKWHRSL